MLIQQNAGLEVVEIAGKGRGVIARRYFARGETVEVCPVLVVEEQDVQQSVLRFYSFHWDGRKAMVLGYGMIYNHSSTPNLEYRAHIEQRALEFTAFTDIAPGDELCTNYNGDPEDETEIEFADGGWHKVYRAVWQRE